MITFARTDAVTLILADRANKLKPPKPEVEVIPRFFAPADTATGGKRALYFALTPREGANRVPNERKAKITVYNRLTLKNKGLHMALMSEFKEFAVKGNVMDLAVGVIIGAAFGKIVDSVVGDLIMPIIGRVLGNVNFADMFWALKDIPAGTTMTLEAVKKAGVPVFAYGNFITVLLNFVILAFIIFLMVKQMNKLKKASPPNMPAPAATAEDILLLREIRDSLRK